MPKLDVVVLSMGSVRSALLPWMLQMATGAKTRGYELGFQVSSERPVCQNRNVICKAFVERDADILMMVDEDMVPKKDPWDLCDAMMAGNGHDVIGYLSPSWKPHMPSPVYWVAARLDDQARLTQAFDLNGAGLLEMDAVGSGVILIHRRVLAHPDMRAPFMDSWTDDGSRDLGHDYRFCLRAKEAGFRIWVAADHMAAHMRMVELLDVAKIIGDYEQELQYAHEQIRALGGEPLQLDAPIVAEAAE